MNYDNIILEIMSRIQDLEAEVKELRELITHSGGNKVTTTEIRNYIEKLKTNATIEGKATLIIRANEIHKGMNLKSRYPMVCNAMRQCMREGDKVLHETASGYSSSLEIEYIV